jgi:cytochrome b561
MLGTPLYHIGMLLIVIVVLQFSGKGLLKIQIISTRKGTGKVSAARRGRHCWMDSPIRAYFIVAVRVVHGGAALKHHLNGKDATLSRMLPIKMKRGDP